jgi:membrane protease subunit (stomatin/prohibitin family)
VCWNADEGECTYCTPKLAQEVTRIRSDARIYQLQDKAMQTDLTEGINVAKPANATCSSCGAAASGGKFCPECGAPLTPPACKGCGAPLGATAKFCAECGTRV